ncbi:formate dehydrogenase subunit gamma [Methylocaldum sp.]|uniref:formate dehydrogenase subunit gamma n=1 Tax=Methylocaldum sp. TaxID=1969727 RepID=UPI002D486266|nr:formate dehydrogenase subunit gamma [Methylocaldum sp.]HYE36017.1 formate dehydrogenase subunit gamma [Methylocaldum sp.]
MMAQVERTTLWRILLAVAFMLLLPLASGSLQAHEGEKHELHETGSVANPKSGYWRQVREGGQGYTAVKGQETSVLIQGGGQNWRQLRNGPLATYGGVFLGLVVFAIGSFYLWRGQVKLNHPRSGETVMRWTFAERILHWYTALLFVFLAITGLSLLYGRALLIPVLGREAFSAYAEIAKLLHNFIGPLFIVGLVLMIVSWAKDNLPDRIDIEWFKALGGMVGDRHPSAGRMNAGEKMWFWLLAVGGLAVSVSGLLLDFPNFGQERWLLQGSHLIHVFFAFVLMAGAVGHIYIGTIGTEGALEGMVTGKVDKSWAIQHHDLWYEKSADAESGSSIANPEKPLIPKTGGVAS